MRLRQLKNKQFIFTFPKALAEAMGWEAGDKINFFVRGKGQIVMKRVENV